MDFLPVNLFMSLSNEKYYKQKNDCIIGDFITAPEVSQMFCHAVGVWVYNAIQSLNKDVILIELGPGYGTLMNEVLNFLRRDLNVMRRIQKVLLLEISEKMIIKQRQKLSHHSNLKFEWIQFLHQIPENAFIVFLANEFFDTMPVQQFVKHNDEFYELLITPTLELVRSNEPMTNMSKIMQYCVTQNFQSGDIYELSTAALTAINQMCNITGGAGLIIDYGYHNSPKRNTIQAIRNHEICDSFMQPIGTADISGRVDFGSMIQFIQQNHSKLKVQYSTQEKFLRNNYIDEIAGVAKQLAKNTSELRAIDQEFYRILHDMGTSFKALEFFK